MAQAVHPQGAAPESSHRKTWPKIAMGCALGCGGLIIIGVLLMVGGFFWISSTGTQYPTEIALTERAVAYFRMENRDEDEGVTQFLSALYGDAQELRREQQLQEVPTWLQDLMEANETRQAEQIAAYLPTEVTLSIEDVGDASEPSIIVAVNFPRFARLFRLVIFRVAAGGMQERYGDFEYLDFNTLEPQSRGGVISFVGETFVFASRVESMLRTLDRAGSNAGNAPSNELGQAFEQLDDRWDFFGVIDNQRGWLEGRDWFDRDSPNQPRVDLSGVRICSLGFDLLSDDSLAGRLDFDCRSSQAAERLEQELRAYMDHEIAEARSENLTLDGQFSRDGRRVTLDLRLDGLRAKMREAFRASAQ